METPSLKYLRELSNGNVIFEKKIFKILIEELPEEYLAYQKAIGEGNLYNAAEIVHKMSHKIAFFQMTASVHVVEKHESDLLNNELNNESEFRDIITNLIKFIPEYLE